MTRVVVLEKVYGPHRPEDFTPAFLTLCSGLSVRVRVTGTIGHGWLVLNVSGEDEEVAIRLLDEEIGLAPVEASRIKRFSTIRGKISSFGPEGIHVDIGVVEPHELTALVRPEVLRAQLADGQDVDVPALASLFCLADGFPLEVKLLEDPSAVEPGEPVDAELSEGQVRLFERWVRLGLDRLIVFGASHHAVKRAIGALGLHDRMVAIERLGLLENAVVLKLGTSPRKMTSALRRRLRNARVWAFRPWRIMRAFPGRYEPPSL